MTTALVRQSRPTAVSRPAMTGLNLGDLLNVAEALVPTGMLPQHITTPGQAVAIILAGRELGMEPMRALRSLRMVKGNVTEAADSMLARFKTDGGRAQFVELTETRAVLKLRHPNGDEHTETFTLEDAQRAGLAGNGGMYAKFPKAMLRSRAITGGLKSLGWEGGAGVYDPSEFAVESPVSSPRAADAGVSGDNADEAEVTLEEALNVTLPGSAEKWNGNGGKRLAELSPRLLDRAGKFFRDAFQKKQDETGEYDERTLRLSVACGLVSAWKKQEEASAQAGVVLEGGRVEDALFPESEGARPRPSPQSEGH